MYKCERCHDTGVIDIDSGGFDMADQPISLGSFPCPNCNINQRSSILNRIQWLQNTRDYAAPEYATQLTAEIERLLDAVESAGIKSKRADLSRDGHEHRQEKAG